MKITAARIEAFIKSPDKNIRCILIYGPDQGLVRERANILAKTVVDALDDPFRVTDLSLSDIKADPARFIDEAMAQSLMGGDRVIRLQGATDAVTKMVKPCVDLVNAANMILIEAANLTPRSSLRKLFETSKTAAVIACYADEARDVSRIINETFRQNGVTASRETIAYLVSSLGGDRRVTRNELEKLCIYAASAPGQSVEISLSEAIECIGDNTELVLDQVIYAACDGNQAMVDKTLAKAFEEGVNSVAVLRGVLRHLQRLQLALAAHAKSGNPDSALSALRPPINFKFKDRFKRQMSNWSLSKVARGMALVTEAEMDCKSTGLPANLICSRVLIRIGQAARR